MTCYLDNAATTPLSKEMKEYLISVLDFYGNPSSSHSKGHEMKQMIEGVRYKISEWMNSNSTDNIYFTSSGSASNTLAIHGFALNNQCEILYSPISHKSILKSVAYLKEKCDMSVQPMNVDCFGNIMISNLENQISKLKKKPFVVFDYANSEIGTIQKVKEIIEIIHKYNGIVFVDCTGSVSTIPIDVQKLDIDMLSFSSHKIGGLKGIGILYKKDNINLKPLIFGSQENGLFAGTENVLGILSAGKAIDLLKYEKTSFARDFVWINLQQIKGIKVVGAPIGANRLINNLYLCIKGIKGTELAALLNDIYDIQVSTGSACNSGNLVPSSTLLAIGFDKKYINDCIRISFSGNETKDELYDFCQKFINCVNMLRND